MSSTDFETQQQQEKGVDSFLSAEERLQLQRFFSKPEEFPKEFGAWIIDYIMTNGVILRSQIQGLTQFGINVDAVGDQDSTTQTSYGDLAHVGPTLEGLSNGTYLILIGSNIVGPTNHNAYMSISVNGAAAADADAIYHGTAAAGTIQLSLARAVVKVLEENNNNSIQAKYRTDGTTCFFLNRWMIALKVS